MNIGDEIRLQFLGGDRYEVVSVTAAKGEEARESDPWPHWYISSDGGFLYRSDAWDNAAWATSYHAPELWTRCAPGQSESRFAGAVHLRRLPSPEAAALLAKWEEDRRPKQTIETVVVQPPPRVFLSGDRKAAFVICADKSFGVNEAGPYSGVVFDLDDCLRMGLHELTGIAADLVIRACAPTPQPELPTAESVAEDVVNQQCGIGRPAIADPDQTVRLSYVVGLIANAIHRDRRIRDKPARRVKHDWTGAMGYVLCEHDGTSFVKWDDGQVTSVYNRHLQKELE